MTSPTPASIEDIPAWMRPGTWMRSTMLKYMGPAFITGINEKGVHYHLAFPWQQHAAIAAWQTGGTIYRYFEHWEPCDDPRDKRSEREQRCEHGVLSPHECRECEVEVSKLFDELRRGDEMLVTRVLNLRAKVDRIERSASAQRSEADHHEACWLHAIATNMIRDGLDGVRLIEAEVSENRASDREKSHDA